jgi:hypothetical protein
VATRRYKGRTTRGRRPAAQRILVVTEGELTERQYVERLNSYLRSKGSVTIVKPVGVGKDPLKVVQKCIELRDKEAGSDKAYDICVCLVDVDQHDSLSSACDLATRSSILLLISNLKFEAWLRWHAEKKRSALSSSQLDALTAKLGLVTDKSLALKFPIHAVDDACAIARRAVPEMEAGLVGPDPSSAMPILVDP